MREGRTLATIVCAMKCFKSTCLVAVIAIGLGACGGEKSPAKEPVVQPPASTVAPPIGSAPQCVDANDSPVKCEKDSDCCEGFVCGRDPELNPREKFCIYAGG